MSARLLLSSVLLLTLAGCSVPGKAPDAAAPQCASGELMQQTTLYFGLNRPHGQAITEAEWQAFVDNDVTPRFKEGLSVFSARGQWLGNDGKLAREESKALMLIHPTDAGSAQRIEALRAVYKQRFEQDSVMRVDAPVCVAF